MSLSHYNNPLLNEMYISKIISCTDPNNYVSGVFFEYKNATATRKDAYFKSSTITPDNCAGTLITFFLEDKEFIYKVEVKSTPT